MSRPDSMRILNWVDVLPAVAAAALGVASVVLEDESVSYQFAALSPLHIVLALLATVPVLFIRGSPMLSYAVILGSTSLLSGLQGQTGLLPAVVAFALGWVAFRVDIWRALAALLLTYLTFALLAIVGAPYFDSPSAWFTVAAFGAFWGIGASAGAWRAAQTRALLESEGARLADESAALRARDEERRRLARELHDEVANSVAAIVVQIDVVESRYASDDAAKLRVVADEGRRALFELRRIVELLRSADADVSDVPAGAVSLSAAVDGLIVADRRLGGRVDGVVDPPGAAVDAARLADILAITKELLANARRHGDGLGTTLRITCTPDQIELQVENGVQSGGPIVHSESSGFGLVGMEERVSAVDGELVVDRAEHTFGVRVRLPSAGVLR